MPMQCPVRASASEACSRPSPSQEARWRRPSPVTVAPAAASATTMPAAVPNSAPTPKPDGPLRLTDDQLAAVLQAAEPLAIGDRGAFLQDVAATLQGQELGDGAVYRTIAQAQR